MSILQTFIGDFYCEGESHHACIWMCVIVFLTGTFLLLLTRMILKYLTDKIGREEKLERDVLADITTKDDHVNLEKHLSEIRQTLNEIKSKVEIISK